MGNVFEVVAWPNEWDVTSWDPDTSERKLFEVPPDDAEFKRIRDEVEQQSPGLTVVQLQRNQVDLLSLWGDFHVATCTVCLVSYTQHCTSSLLTRNVVMCVAHRIRLFGFAMRLIVIVWPRKTVVMPMKNGYGMGPAPLHLRKSWNLM